MVFFYTIILFIFYDRLVESRQRLILAKATKSTAIVASLFPKNVRDRLLNVDPEEVKQSKSGVLGSLAGNQRLKNYLGGDAEAAQAEADQPIADLFPHCTVFFADIAGFTAWSSTREPAQGEKESSFFLVFAFPTELWTNKCEPTSELRSWRLLLPSL